MILRSFPLVVIALAASPSLVSAATILVYSKSVGLEIPDNDFNGFASQLVVSNTDIVTSVQLTLVTSRGWNGDLYAYLTHNGVISVVLNRPGRTSANPAGAASSGMNVSFSDAAVVDVHTGLPGVTGELASGIFQPDGRASDPLEVTDASPRTLGFDGFTGQIAAGEWTLFVADVAGGETATLDSWTLTLNVVPEPSAVMVFAAFCVGGLLIRKRAPSVMV